MTQTVGGKQAIDYFSRRHPLRRQASKIGFRARKAMYEMFVEQLRPTEADRVVDIGVTPDEEMIDSNFFEQLYPWRERITATSVEDASNIEQRFPGVTFVQTEPGRLPFEDAAFELAFCSAVVEHVGPENQKSFVAEVTRVAGGCFVTVPNRWYPIEVHTFLPFLHWLPRSTHRRLLRLLRRPFWADPANLHLLSAREFVALFPPEANVRILRKRTFGFTSNLVAVVAR